MKPRIKSLLAQAHVEAENLKDTNWIAERFAELIVKECARIARDYTLSRWNLDNSYSDTVIVEKRIKEHFGVE